MSRALQQYGEMLDRRRERREPAERKPEPQWAQHAGLTVVQMDAPDDLSSEQRQVLVDEARAERRPLRAIAIATGLVTPRPKRPARTVEESGGT